MHMLLFLVALVIPGFVYGHWECDSYAVGILVSSLMTMGLAAITGARFSSLLSGGGRPLYLLISFAWAVVGIQALLIVFLDSTREIDVTRLLLSLVLLCLMAVSAFALLRLFETASINPDHYSRLCVLGLMSMLALTPMGLHVWDRAIYVKSIGVYPEPSHFALVAAPFFLHLAVVSSGWMRVAILLVLAGMGVTYESLLILVVSAAICVITMPIYGSLLYIAIIGSILFFTEKGAYFFERLALAEDVENLSLLVYLNGWDIAWTTLQNTSGIGCGFQQLGFDQASEGRYSEAIVRQAMSLKNERDGGFLASKIICEMGVVGVAICGSVVWLGLKAAIFLRSVAFANDHNKHNFRLGRAILYNCIATSFLLEFLIRGGGYFTTGVWLFLFALLGLKHERDAASFDPLYGHGNDMYNKKMSTV